MLGGGGHGWQWYAAASAPYLIGLSPAGYPQEPDTYAQEPDAYAQEQAQFLPLGSGLTKVTDCKSYRLWWGWVQLPTSEARAGRNPGDFRQPSPTRGCAAALCVI